MKRTDIQKILVIGSGPIVIGQAAEFDYAGTQACMALKEEGYQVILVNSNPATIMTDTNIADVVYMEPLTVEFISQIIRKEKPDALLPTLGGQTGLNLAVELANSGILDKYGVEMLGTNLSSIERAEDRQQFRQLMEEIGEPVPESTIVHTVEEAIQFTERIGYPVIVRPAYTLGGTGGGMCDDREELIEIVANGLKVSPVHQCLIERSIAGFKEIEYEVMRDSSDDAIAICDMENVDPVGIHTGDSIVVAPIQTLEEKEKRHLKNISLKIIRALGIEGGCNVQIAYHSETKQYYIIEVNPRVSRSSALASKATGFPIAKVAAKIAVGMTLNEILHNDRGLPVEMFEPNVDYIVTKIPRWPFDKFDSANRTLGTQMKATGEVMAIGKTFEESLLKAVRSLELGVDHLELKERNIDNGLLEKRIRKAEDERLFYIGEALRRKVPVEKIHEWSQIDPFFLRKMEGIIQLEELLVRHKGDVDLLRRAKTNGFSDRAVAKLWQTGELEIYRMRKLHGLLPGYRAVKTYGDEKDRNSPYFYGTYGETKTAEVSDRESILVIGSGPIRIGQGIEFDYATVHSIWAIKEKGYETIVMNNNPETVSTDYNISDKLYFEPLTIEDVMHVIDRERPVGVVVQFGGQTAINLASELVQRGVRILGTSLENMDRAEDRQLFEDLLEGLQIPKPEGATATNRERAVEIADGIGYPVLVRPSYVLGGRAMEIVHTKAELLHYMEQAIKIHSERPILIDRYLFGKEIEVDAISDGRDVLIPGIIEHIERAGVHSGDSIAVYPARNVTARAKEKIVEYTIRLARALQIVGLINIQYVAQGDEVYVLEVNPRSSRTVPFLSKITDVPIASIATKVILGDTLEQLGFRTQYLREKPGVYVKMPVFSFAKLRNVDATLGPEMKSTGEVIGQDQTLEKALYKGFISSGMEIETNGSVILTIADKDKKEVKTLAERLHRLGYRLLATEGTARFLEGNGIPAEKIQKIHSNDSNNILRVIEREEVRLVINTFTTGKKPESDGFRIRRVAVENRIPCLTSLDTAKAILQVIESLMFSLEPKKASQQREEVLS